MQSPHNKAMFAAIAKRRGRGIDVNALSEHENAHMGRVGDEEPHGSEQSGELAPSVKDSIVSHDLAKHELEESALHDQGHKELGEVEHDSDDHDQTMLGDMSQHDLEDMKQRKPRSLGERARMAALDRMHNKGKEGY